MKNFIERLKNYKTSILGVATGIFAVMVGFGIVTADGSVTGVQAVNGLYEGVLAILGSISGIVLLLSKDPK